MDSRSRRSSILSLGKLIAKEIRKFLKSPFPLVLGLILIVIISAFALGTLWDSRGTLGLP